MASERWRPWLWLGKYLLPLRETLAHLVLRFDMFREGKHGLDFLEDMVEGDLALRRSFTALASMETSLGLLFGEDVHTLRDDDDLTHMLADVLPRNLRKVTITDDLWVMGRFVTSEERMTMSTFLQYFSWDTIGPFDAVPLSTEEVDRTKNEDLPWRQATPELKEFVFDIRKRGKKVAARYWGNQRRRDYLQHVCERQGIACSILYEDQG
jgi:hypothetical protein